MCVQFTRVLREKLPKTLRALLRCSRSKDRGSISLYASLRTTASLYYDKNTHHTPRGERIKRGEKIIKSHSPTKHTEVFFINYFGKMRVFPHGSVIKIEEFGISHFHLKDGQGRLFIT